MSKQLSPERRKVVILSSSIAAVSAGTLPLIEKHPQVAIAWLCFLGVALVYVVMQLVRIKRSRR